MTTLDKLSFLMRESNLNKRQLSIKSELPYSTVDNYWKRGSGSMRLPTFMKLCDFFGVTMDSMAYDDKEIEYRVNEKSDFNKRLTRAYFEHPEQQPSVRKLLDLPDQEEEIGRKEGETENSPERTLTQKFEAGKIKNSDDFRKDLKMCYLIAKKFNDHGCVAVQSEYGEALASLVDYLGRRTEKNGIQVLTVSSKEAFNEYAPYNEVDSEKSFINAVFEMAQ